MKIPLCKNEDLVLKWNGSDPSGPPYRDSFLALYVWSLVKILVFGQQRTNNKLMSQCKVTLIYKIADHACISGHSLTWKCNVVRFHHDDVMIEEG